MSQGLCAKPVERRCSPGDTPAQAAFPAGAREGVAAGGCAGLGSASDSHRVLAALVPGSPPRLRGQAQVLQNRMPPSRLRHP